MVRYKSLAVSLAAALALAACANTGTGKKIENVTKLEHCPQPLGPTIIDVKDEQTWRDAKLQNPTLFLQKDQLGPTGCFDFVAKDKPHRYVLEPKLQSTKHETSATGGKAATGILMVAPIPVAPLLSFFDTDDSTADVMLTLIDTETGRKITAEGLANQGTQVKIPDYNDSSNVYSSDGDETYLSKSGAIAAQAFMNASAKLIAQLGSLSAHEESDVKPLLEVKKPGHLFKEPSTQSAVVLKLSPGTKLHSTGNQKGNWYEVEVDGRRGWTAGQILDLPR